MHQKRAQIFSENTTGFKAIIHANTLTNDRNEMLSAN